MDKRLVISYLKFAISVITSVFFFAAFLSAGFLIISMTMQSTNVQLEGMGEEMLKNRVHSVSAVGSVVQPGAAVIDMEKHVSDLQQNIDTPKNVQTATGGS